MIALSELTHPQWLAFSGLLGLCIGSFLNVVIHRLPIMMQRAWAQEVAEIQGHPTQPAPTLNLIGPASHCPHCNTPLAWWQNIPLLSFLLLKGQCKHCQAPISWRYPLVELFTACAALGVAHLHSPSTQALLLMGFVFTLIALTAIDLDTYLLPDDLTLPLLWAGLLFNLVFEHVSLTNAVIGASAGYLLLWSIYQLFKLATGKEGMGYGDFKLLAAIGAWLGVQSLFTILLSASLFGIFFGLLIQTLRGKQRHEAFPFGPCLALGAFAWLGGFDISRWI